MKQGDKIDVTIHGVKVADAVIQEVGDGQVTLVVPGTIVVMATSTSIAPEAVAPENTVPAAPVEVEHQITGVDRVSSDGTVTSTGQEPIGGPTNVGTPEVVAPPVTDPGETSGVAANEQAKVETVAPVENVNPTVSDNASPENNAVGDTDVPQQ